MHIKKFGFKLDEIRRLLEVLRECRLHPKVATAEEQAELQETVEAVFDRYEEAIQNDEVYIPLIRRKLNRIIFTLRRWIEYDDLEAEKDLKRWARFL